MLPNNYLKVFRKVTSLTSLRSFSEQPLVVAKRKREALNISKKPCRPPFMKNVFIGIFDSEMLLYPELDKESLKELKTSLEPLKQFVNNNVDPLVISSLRVIPSEVKEYFKSLGLFGQIIPSVYGGFDYSATETALISEIVAKDLDVALTLYTHNFLGAQTILLYGTEDQKAKYLPQLASGERIAAFCLSECVSSSDINNLSAKLSQSDSSDVYLLNGEKHWVTNANNASLFIVLAKLDSLTHTGHNIPLIRLAIVERDSPGVSVSPPVEHFGMKASNLCEVNFKNTPVPVDCFLGSDLQGYEMCSKILNSRRYNVGAITISVLKTLLNKASDFIISRKQFHKPLSECQLIHKKCLDIAQCIFILESMTYHTAAILDNYDNPDCSIELAIIKTFSFTEGRRCLDLVMELLGGRAYLNSDSTQKYFRDFRTMELFDGTTDISNLFISLTGIQHAGSAINESVAKLRRPYQYPEAMIKFLMRNRKHVNDNPKLTLKLYEQLHPSLTDSANELEYCVLRLQYAVSILFKRYGSDVINQQFELMRIADAAVKIYAMTCVLGRASRSYCIGLRNAETEVKYAITICSKYKVLVQHELNDLIDGYLVSGDFGPLSLGPDILDNHGYFLEHPLERSY